MRTHSVIRLGLSLFACVSMLALFTAAPGVADDRKDEPREHTTDTLETVQGRLEEKKAVLVDVRELVEWNAGHVQGAKLIPWRELQDKLTEEDIAKRIPKDLIIYTYCAVGYRSLRAAKILKKYGYEVRALKPGYEDLVKAGFPSEKPEKKGS